MKKQTTRENEQRAHTKKQEEQEEEIHRVKGNKNTQPMNLQKQSQ